jgi:hypothetical protein
MAHTHARWEQWEHLAVGHSCVCVGGWGTKQYTHTRPQRAHLAVEEQQAAGGALLQELRPVVLGQPRLLVRLNVHEHVLRGGSMCGCGVWLEGGRGGDRWVGACALVAQGRRRRLGNQLLRCAAHPELREMTPFEMQKGPLRAAQNTGCPSAQLARTRARKVRTGLRRHAANPASRPRCSSPSWRRPAPAA